MGNLITPSVLASLDWLKNCPTSWKVKAYTDMRGALLRRYFSTKATEQGIAFENAIYHLLGKGDVQEVGNPTVDHFLRVCKGGNFQAKYSKPIEVDGVEYTLYGKFDVDLKDKIIDIKTTAKYRKGKYLSTPQHLIYCLMSGKKEFEYHICEWEKDEEGKTKIDSKGNYFPGPVFEEKYTVSDFKELELEIKAKIRAFIQGLRDYDLLDGYENYFVKNIKG